jgi:hypothetical protein
VELGGGGSGSGELLGGGSGGGGAAGAGEGGVGGGGKWKKWLGGAGKGAACRRWGERVAVEAGDGGEEGARVRKTSRRHTRGRRTEMIRSPSASGRVVPPES